MDPLTHALIGGLTAKTVKVSRRRFWIMVLLGNVPDLDVLANGLGSWAYFIQHRGLSHSLLGVIFQTVFFAWVLKRWDPGEFKTRILHYFIPIFSHIACDYLTSYGVPLLAPYTFYNFSADLVGGVELIPIIFMSFGLLWLYYKEQQGWKATRSLWAAWGIYLVLSFTGTAYATKLTDLQKEGLTTVPSMINPFCWRAVYWDPSTRNYHYYSVNLLKKRCEPTLVFPGPPSDWVVKASLKSEKVMRFLMDNRWPVVRVNRENENWKVEWGNIMFSARGTVRGKVAVTVSPSGKILEEKNSFTFWEPT